MGCSGSKPNQAPSVVEKPVEKTNVLSSSEASKKTEASTPTPSVASMRPESTNVAPTPLISQEPANIASTGISVDTSAVVVEVNGHGTVASSGHQIQDNSNLQHKESVQSINSDSSPVKSALKHKGSASPESSSPKRALRFQIEEPVEITPTPSTEVSRSTAAIAGLDDLQQVSGTFGGYDFPFFGDQTLYRIQNTDAALKKTAKFAVFTHLSYETTEELEIVLDDAPPEVVHRELVRQASFLSGNSKQHTLRFVVDTDSSPTLTPLSSPLIRSPEAGLTRVSSFGLSRPPPINAPSRSLLLAKARSERNPNIRQELVRLDSGVDFD
eukprot:gene42008-51283_t